VEGVLRSSEILSSQPRHFSIIMKIENDAFCRRREIRRGIAVGQIGIQIINVSSELVEDQLFGARGRVGTRDWAYCRDHTLCSDFIHLDWGC
jgi:hypothetical protein